nr:MraY family glycosyltransferase [Elusimicrobiota bacterium]
MIYLDVLIISLLVSLIVTKLCEKAAAKTGFYDIPHTDLKTHSEPTPYAGSSIWLSFMIVMIGLRLFTSYQTGTLHQLRGILYGGGIIYLLGIMDDIFDLNYIIKFIGQVIAVVILIRYDIYIKLFPHQALNYIFSIFWVILIINAINIIDVMDGLSAGVASIAAMAFFLVTLPTEKIYVNFTALILFGALAGFWFFNRPQAKVFMGDAGSLFTGFILAAASMGADYSSGHLIGIFAPFLILGVPIYDTLLVSYFRYRKGMSVFKGSHDHYALRLKRRV